MKKGLWTIVLIIIAIICMMDFAEAAEPETKPTYETEKLNTGNYKTTFSQEGVVFYSVETGKRPFVLFVDRKFLPNALIENRSKLGLIIVERDIGVVLNEIGDGMDTSGYYLFYGGHVHGFQVGDVIETYCIYDPNNDYIDGIEGRCDYIVQRAEWK